MLNYLLLKKKSSKLWEVAVPLRKGVTKATAKKQLKGAVRKGYQAMVVTETELKRILNKAGAKLSKASSSTRKKRTTKRKSTSTKRKSTKNRGTKRKSRSSRTRRKTQRRRKR